MLKNRFSVKFSIILLLVLFLCSISGLGEIYAKDAPGVSASVNKKSFSPGESGVITISFKTGSKVKIPKDPGVTIEITSGNIQGNGVQDYSGGDGDYIDGSKVRYNFTVPSDAAPGSSLTVSGTVGYGYCTVSDGVCKLANKQFSVKIRIK
ncbi:MAG: hypothetical protein HGGPFJEG_02826 [Ignavibacteria bacterium]|nr:hypothetical protein [Ignavibacteria bacterium]